MGVISISAWEGCLLGAAVGDSLGLPREGLSRRRAARWWPETELRHRLVFGRGMLSDDGEQVCMLTQALIAGGGDPSRFARSLGWRLRWWMLGVPAGVGMATLRAIFKLWLGFPSTHSGVRSAGNGAAMRAAPLGLYCAEDLTTLAEWVRVGSMVTHTDARAFEGALAVAWAAGFGARHGAGGDPADLFSKLLPLIGDADLRSKLEQIAPALATGRTAEMFADSLGLASGVGGYVNHTVPVALYCWLRHAGDFRGAVSAAIRLGGDVDTVGSIVGGLAGATTGVEQIPTEWLAGLVEWPRSVGWIRQLARRAQAAAGGDRAVRPCTLFWPALPLRNVAFIAIVLTHGLRRLLPPY